MRADGPAAPGAPYTSLVLASTDHASAPIMLLSGLSDHTRNIAADGRVSLLYDGTSGREDPLIGPRVSLLGHAERLKQRASETVRLRERLLARHPGANVYAGFADFALYRVRVERVHLVAGFGDARWMAADRLLFDITGSTRLAEEEATLLAALNASGSAAGLPAAGAGWSIVGIDPEGIDLRSGSALMRLRFERPVADADGVRQAITRLARRT